MAEPSTSSQLKAKGNESFNAEDYAKAEELYTAALAAVKGEAEGLGSEEGDVTACVLLGNRSAARLLQNNIQGALEDAEAAINEDSSWLKGYHRKACALKAQEDLVGEVCAYEQALKLKPNNKWMQERKKEAAECLVEQSKAQPVPSKTYWSHVFRCLVVPKERLFVLATFWNLCTKEERLTILARFLEVVAGPNSLKTHTGVKASDFDEDAMADLPMGNYEGLEEHETWFKFLHESSMADKVALFEDMWQSTDEKEKGVIMADMQFFFLKPLVEARARNNDSSNIQADLA
ncbi:unnamed protein product [Chrysoparadoxa australica]